MTIGIEAQNSSMRKCFECLIRESFARSKRLNAGTLSAKTVVMALERFR